MDGRSWKHLIRTPVVVPLFNAFRFLAYPDCQAFPEGGSVLNTVLLFTGGFGACNGPKTSVVPSPADEFDHAVD